MRFDPIRVVADVGLATTRFSSGQLWCQRLRGVLRVHTVADDPGIHDRLRVGLAARGGAELRVAFFSTAGSSGSRRERHLTTIIFILEGEEVVEADDSFDLVEGREVCCRSDLDEAGRRLLKGRDVGLERRHAYER